MTTIVMARLTKIATPVKPDRQNPVIPVPTALKTKASVVRGFKAAKEASGLIAKVRFSRRKLSSVETKRTTIATVA